MGEVYKGELIRKLCSAIALCNEERERYKMHQTLVLNAALFVIGVQAFPPGIYFAENADNATFLKHWDPYSHNNTVHQVTCNAYELLGLLEELLKTSLSSLICSYAFRRQSNRSFCSSYFVSDCERDGLCIRQQIGFLSRIVPLRVDRRDYVVR